MPLRLGFIALEWTFIDLALSIMQAFKFWDCNLALWKEPGFIKVHTRAMKPSLSGILLQPQIGIKGDSLVFNQYELAVSIWTIHICWNMGTHNSIYQIYLFERQIYLICFLFDQPAPSFLGQLSLFSLSRQLPDIMIAIPIFPLSCLPICNKLNFWRGEL